MLNDCHAKLLQQRPRQRALPGSRPTVTSGWWKITATGVSNFCRTTRADVSADPSRTSSWGYFLNNLQKAALYQIEHNVYSDCQKQMLFEHKPCCALMICALPLQANEVVVWWYREFSMVKSFGHKELLNLTSTFHHFQKSDNYMQVLAWSLQPCRLHEWHWSQFLLTSVVFTSSMWKHSCCHWWLLSH